MVDGQRVDVATLVNSFNIELEGLSLYERIEIMANVMISSGMLYMSVPEEISEITPENIVDIVIKDKNSNGETLQNALAQQGLVMLMWLSKKEK